MEAMYQYEALDMTKCVTRIIRLEGAKNFDDPLHCEMLTVRLAVEPDDRPEEYPQYEAISYTWEGQEPSTEHFIFIRSRNNTLGRLFVTANAQAALRRMRLKSGYRNLWVDSVSINQKSLKEKNFQVRNMGHVFTSASAVLVWLGETVKPHACLTIAYLKRIASYQAEDPLAERALQKIFSEIRQGQPTANVAYLMRANELMSKKVSKNQQKTASHRKVKKWSLMEDFFSHPWFSRVWTLREIALNMSDPLFHYGDETIKLSQIAHAMATMFDRVFDHASVIQEALGPHLSLRSKLKTWRACWSHYEIGPTLFFKFTGHDAPRFRLGEILEISHRMDASNPVDKVYGAHGICEWLDIYLPNPRYDHGVEDAFFEVTRMAIMGFDDLSVLYEVNGPRRNDKLPSWVPDWACGWRRMYGVPLTSSAEFNTGGAKALYHIDSEERLLKLKCKFIDDVEHVGDHVSVYEDMPFFASLESDWLIYEGVPENSWAAWQAFRGWASLLHQNYSQSAALMDDLFSTLVDPSLISGRSKYSSPEALLEPEKAKGAFKRWYNALLETNDAAAKETTQFGKDLTNRVYFGRNIFWEGSDKDMRLVHFNVWVRATGKCLFVTRPGRIGLGVGNILPGQKIAVVAGLKMPLVLESVGKRYRLVGHAYVHGVMKGETWPADSRELITVSLE